ncbi:SET domain protein [Alkalihalophilus pseudofirmus OF4]|uniref:SET domain protein n=1 Tax=Alkalihalophilus pseudofirmus (strain ATCC BAA-2126 / JCM 17055 / OF4) TaxID=398511 RepID=D3FW40_ALKPO|nr:SET domain-containing protein [Alkalihalophilus pseudofirmus]ADC50472.1 SET domain protein [Alkalihalophilus pseudofirmus OF4]
MITVKTSPVSGGEFNRGVFATEDIPKGTMFHEAPVVPYPNIEHILIQETVLADYVYEYGKNHTAIVLGYGMLFNHSFTPNATYDINFDKHIFSYYAYRDIKAGEEIFVNYNGEVADETPLWFMKDK